MKRLMTALFAVVCLIVLTGEALACACCAEAGSYMNYKQRPNEFTLGLLDSIQFDKKAVLFMTEAGFDTIKGLSEVEKEYGSPTWTPGSDDFDLVSRFVNKSWKFTFKTPGGKPGVLTLPLPAQMEMFKVDTRETKDTGLGVRLYKEMRFRGYVQNGTGIFRSGIIKPTSYLLVFQGRGNGCDDVSDFTHWHLEIDGKKASYEFNGKLTAGEASANAQ